MGTNCLQESVLQLFQRAGISQKKTLLLSHNIIARGIHLHNPREAGMEKKFPCEDASWRHDGDATYVASLSSQFRLRSPSGPN